MNTCSYCSGVQHDLGADVAGAGGRVHGVRTQQRSIRKAAPIHQASPDRWWGWTVSDQWVMNDTFSFTCNYAINPFQSPARFLSLVASSRQRHFCCCCVQSPATFLSFYHSSQKTLSKTILFLPNQPRSIWNHGIILYVVSKNHLWQNKWRAMTTGKG